VIPIIKLMFKWGIMNTQNQEVMISLKVSYYSSYKEWKLKANFTYWPHFIVCFLPILSYVFTGGSSLTVFLLFLGAFLFLFFLFTTRFYTNSILIISDNGLAIKRKDKIIDYNWSEILKVEFITPRQVPSYLQIILTIHTNTNDIEYVFIDSLYFKTARSRATELKFSFEKYLKGCKFIILESDFEPLLLDKKCGPPNTRAAKR